MQSTLTWLGGLAGAVGAVLCLIGGVTRLMGNFWLGGFQAGTLLQAGSAMMTFACLCFLVLLVGRGGGR